MSYQRPTVSLDKAPMPDKAVWPNEPQYRYLARLAGVIGRLFSSHARYMTTSTNPAVMGIGVEQRQITSGPMRDCTGRVLDAGVLNIAAPNTAQLILAVGRVFQDANYNVHFTGGYVPAIPSPALLPFGIAAVNVEVDAHVQIQVAGGFMANVTWTALDAATACDQPMHTALPPQGTMWHDYAAMAAAYGFLAPYNALATAVGLNSIQYTVVDR